MFQKLADLEGSFVNDEYFVKRFDRVDLDRENEKTGKSKKLLKALDDDWISDPNAAGSCICDRLPGLVSVPFNNLYMLKFLQQTFLKYLRKFVGKMYCHKGSGKTREMTILRNFTKFLATDSKMIGYIY